MAKKQADVEFLIRSRNLSSKTMKQVTDELRDLIDQQERQKSVAASSKASLSQLEDGYKKLGTVLADLNARRDVVESLIGKRGEMDAAKAKVNALRVELAELLAVKGKGTFLGDIDKAIKSVRRGLSGADSEFNRTSGAVEKLEQSLAGFGINADNVEHALRELRDAQDQVVVQQVRSKKAIEDASAALDRNEKKTREAADAENRLQRELAETLRFEQELAAQRRQFRVAESRAGFEEGFAAREAAERALAEQRIAREKEITAEVQRRNALEEQAESRRIAALRREGDEATRIAQKRADSFAAFSQASASQLRTPQDRSEVLARQQVLERDAALKILEINKRADAVEERLAATRARLAGATGNLATNTNKARSAQSLFNNDSRQSLGVQQRLVGQVYSLVSAYFGLFGAINVVKGAMDAVTTQEGIQVKLRVANNGDAKKAAEDFEFLKRTADDLGLVFVDLSKKFADYKIAATSAGVTNDLVRQSFTDVSKAIAVNRLSQEDADGVLRAMVQIMSKARVQAEELRGQLGDRLPGAVAMFAKANNIALSDLDEKLKKGEIGVDFLLRGLREAAKRVESELPQATNTAQSALNRLKNSYNEFLVTLGKSGVVDALKAIFTSLTQFLQSNDGQEAARQLGEAFKSFAEIIKALIANLDKVAIALKVLLALQVLRWADSVRIAIVGMGASLIRMGVAARTAAAGTGALSVASRGLLALFGPIGIAAAAAATAIYLFDRANRQATENAERFTTSLGRLRNAQGNAILGELKTGVAELRQRQQELKDLQARLKTAEKNDPISQKSATLRGRTIGETGLDKIFGESPTILREKIALATTQLEGLAVGVKNATARYKEFRTEASKDIPVPDFTPPKSDESDGKAAEKARKLAERIADQRLNIEHRTADAFLDIEKDVAQARVDTNVVSQDQIEANLKQTLSAIDLEIQKKRADLEKLKEEAGKIGSTKGVASADAAIEQLKVLQDAQTSRAKEKATMESMQLLEKQLNDLIEVRDQKLENIATRQELGLITQFEAQQEANKEQLDSQDAIMAKVVALRDFIVANAGVLGQMMNIDATLLKLDGLITKTKEATTASSSFLHRWRDDIANGIANTFSTLAEGLAGFLQGANSLSDAFKSARDAFLSFASDFLINIGKMIIQAIILQAIKNAINGTSGGYFGAAMSAIGTAHTGGMVGSPRHSYREVSPLMFSNAPRYHSGGFPGLRADEVPIIAQRGEEVLARTDPRNAMNGGGGAQSPQVKIINAIDSASVVSEAMNRRDGQTPVINMMKARRQEIKAALGIK